jgi:AcrR family transcriptional regulator
MVIRQRAMQAEDKRERYEAILDAAERVLTRAPDQAVNVADVADEARLAKGTVYLYFPSKDELLLAVHERRIDAFFRDVIALVEGERPVSIDPMLELTRRHIVEPPLFLPLASRCFGLMAHNIPPETAVAFRQRMAGRLERAGAGLERHFPALPAGGGLALLRRSYALILGLWQMSAGRDADNAHCARIGPAPSRVFVWSYPTELEFALRALWRGMVAAPAAMEVVR